MAETIIALTQLWIIRKELSMAKIFASGMHYWIAGGFMLALVLLENRYLTPSALATCVMIGSGGLMYLA